MKIAIIGTGIAGNVAALKLHRAHDITVYEAGGHVGGHTHTHRIELDGEVQHVDTGFIVFNDRTYPHFIALLAELGVASHDSAMSFSVRNEHSGLEYNGTSLNSLFAQRRNLVRPSFLRMLRDILRFNREAPRLLDADGDEITLGDYLAEHRYSRQFLDDYLVPMGAAIWSTDPQRMLGFPARFFVRFMHNHGMLTVNDRPTWRVVTRRLGALRRAAGRAVAPPHPPALRGHAGAAPDRRRVGQRAGRADRALRPRVLRLPCRPGAARAGRPVAGGARDPRRAAVPAQRGRAAHRHLAAAAAPAGLGGLELPRAARAGATRGADLQHEHPAGTELAPHVLRDAEPRRRHRPAARAATR